MRSGRSSVGKVAVVAFATALAVAGCGSASNSASGGDPFGGAKPDGEPIIIGMDEDSTGPGAAFSTIAGDAVRDAVAQVNAEGGILDRPVELIVENDESDPTKTPTVLRKLVSQGAVALILQTSGGAINQAKSVITDAGLLAVSPTSTSQSIATPPNNEFTYTLANPVSDFVKAYCGAFQATGIKTLGILSDTSVTIKAVNDLMLPGLHDCVDVVAEESAPVNASDLNAQVARIRSADPDAVLVSSAGGSFEVLAHNTLYQTMPKVQRFSLASIGNESSAWKLANPGALDGLVYLGSIDEDNPQTKKVQDLLDKTRGDDYTVTAFDANGYDTVHLIKRAIESAGGTDDPTAIRDAFNAIQGYEASFGQPGFTLSYGPDKHLGADGLCGLVLTEFGSDNTPEGPWGEYQPPC